MATKTISLTEDAYERLAAMKRPGESFSDVIRRMTRKTSLLDLAGIMPKEAVEEVRRNIEEAKEERLRRRKEELGLE